MSTLEALIQAGQALPYAERQKLIAALRRGIEPEPLEAEIADAEARAALMRDIAASMKANSFTGNPARFTREELHERR